MWHKVTDHNKTTYHHIYGDSVWHKCDKKRNSLHKNVTESDISPLNNLSPYPLTYMVTLCDINVTKSEIHCQVITNNVHSVTSVTKMRNSLPAHQQIKIVLPFPLCCLGYSEEKKILSHILQFVWYDIKQKITVNTTTLFVVKCINKRIAIWINKFRFLAVFLLKI